MLKMANRALEWGHLEATIIHGVAYWLWQDLNAVMGRFLFIYFLFLVYLLHFFEY